MGTNIIAAGITAPPAARRRIRMPGSVPAPLVWSWLGHTLDISRTNLAGLGLTPHALVGTGGAIQTVDLLTYLRTNANTNMLSAAIDEPASWTILTVFRTLDTLASGATRPALGGWYNSSLGSAVRGGGGIMNSATGLQMWASFDNAGTPQNTSLALTISTPSNWRLAAMTVQSGVGMTVRDLTNSLVASNSVTLTRSPRAAACRIAGTYDQPSGQGDFAMWGLWNSALSLDQMTLLRSSVIAPLMATRGITV